MAQGLKLHHHQEFEYRTEQYFDKREVVWLRKFNICVWFVAMLDMKNTTVMYHHQNLKPNH